MRRHVSSLLSLLPPSCMVVPKIDLVDTFFPLTINSSTSLQDQSATILIYIEVDTPRGQSSVYNINNSRESSVHSNTCSVIYVNHIQAMVTCPT